MNDTPRTKAKQWRSNQDCHGQTCMLVDADFAEELELENKILRAAILEFTGELTYEQLEYHEADPPYENSRPDIARLYRIATSENLTN